MGDLVDERVVFEVVFRFRADQDDPSWFRDFNKVVESWSAGVDLAFGGRLGAAYGMPGDTGDDVGEAAEDGAVLLFDPFLCFIPDFFQQTTRLADEGERR